jgi:probable O-glycosylation ligase (exosortase A-associated)
MDSSTNWWRPTAQTRQQTETPTETATRPVAGPDVYGLVFWALIGFTTIMLLAPQQRFPILAPLRLALLSVGVAVVAYVYNRLSSGKPVIDFRPDVVLLTLLVAWAVLTLPFSMWPTGSLNTLTNQFIKSAIAFLLISHALTNVRQLWGISWCLALCAIPLTMTAVSNYVSGVYIGDNSTRVVGYDAGLTGNPNDMALMLNLMLPLCAAILLGSRNTLVKLLMGAIAGLIVAAIVVTFSRAGFVMLVFTAIAYAWRLRNRPQRIWIPMILALGVLALPLVPENFYDRINTIVNYEEDRSGSAQERLADMQVATKVAFSNPIKGAGLGVGHLAMNEARGETWKVIHTLYLQVAVDLGFVGLLLYLGLMFKCIGATGKILRHDPEDPLPERLVLIAEALRISLMGFAIAVMFYPVAYNFYFFYFGALAIAAGNIAEGMAPEGRT